MEQPTLAALERILQDAEVDIAVGTHGRRGSAVIGQKGIAPRDARVLETYFGQRLKRSAVQGEQVPRAKARAAHGVHGDIEGAAVIAQRRGVVLDYLLDVGVAGSHTGRDPGAVSGRVDAGDSALQAQRPGSRHLEAEVNVAVAVRGDRRIDEHAIVEGARVVVLDAVEGE